MADELQTLKYENTIKVLNEFAQAIVEKYKDNLEAFGNIASQKLYKSVSVHTVSFDGQKMVVSINLEKYWKFVENGRGAGKMPPVEAIQDWIDHKPQVFAYGASTPGVPGYASLTPSLSDSGIATKTTPLAWAIATKIKKEGTTFTPKPVLATTMKETMEIFRHKITEALALDLGNVYREVVASVWVDRNISKVDGEWVDLEIRDSMVL